MVDHGHQEPPGARKGEKMKHSHNTGVININTGKKCNFAKFIYSGSKAKKKMRKKGK